MKSLRLAAIVLVLGAACASAGNRPDAPKVDVVLAPLNATSDIFYFRGPITLDYQIGFHNPSDEPLTLTRLELRTEGGGAYRISTAAPMKLNLPARSNVSYKISVWGRALGGYIRQDEPVTMRITAYFDSPRGNFVRTSTEMLRPTS